jgi:tartrate dehydratase beta subunit/fumarate hydratase class I family protein
MTNDETAVAIGKLQGTIEANHTETLKRFDAQGEEIKALQQVHWKQKGMMSTISLLVVAVFHAIVGLFEKHN